MDNLVDQKCSTKCRTFDLFPDEIIHKIFKYLDTKSIKICSLTCSRWANIIANSTPILKMWKLKLSSSFWRSKENTSILLSSQRKLTAIEITYLRELHHDLIIIFEKFGPNLCTLSIMNSRIDDFTLQQILRRSTVLQNLHLFEVMINERLPIINSVSLVHLTSLTIIYCEWIVFKILSKAQIYSLKVNSYNYNGESTDALIYFLLQQRRLKELVLYGTSAKKLFQVYFESQDCNYRLNTLKIQIDIGMNSDMVNKNMTNCLSLHKETLTNVEISVPNGDLITSLILNDFNNIKSLTLNVCGLPKGDDFYGNLKNREPNTNLNFLKLSGHFLRVDFVKIILQKYPNIKNLELDDWSDATSKSDMLTFVSKQLPDLQNLCIPAITNPSNIEFSSLKYVKIKSIRNVGNLVKFIKVNRSVEVLKIGFVYEKEVPSIRNLMDLRNIQLMSFKGSTHTLEMIINLFRPYSSQTLKLLELVHDEPPDRRFANRKIILLNIPLDEYEISTKLKHSCRYIP